MAMYMCPICEKGVSTSENHKCVPPRVPYNVMKTSGNQNTFFVGYKPTIYFNTTERK